MRRAGGGGGGRGRSSPLSAPFWIPSNGTLVTEAQNQPVGGGGGGFREAGVRVPQHIPAPRRQRKSPFWDPPSQFYSSTIADS